MGRINKFDKIAYSCFDNLEVIIKEEKISSNFVFEYTAFSFDFSANSVAFDTDRTWPRIIFTIFLYYNIYPIAII